MGHFERKFQGEGGRPATTGVVCVILRLAVLIQYPRVTDRYTHARTQTDTTKADTYTHG